MGRACTYSSVTLGLLRNLNSTLVQVIVMCHFSGHIIKQLYAAFKDLLLRLNITNLLA